MAGICVAFALVHIGIWMRRRADRTQLYFAAYALSIGGISVGELLMMRARSAREFETVMRWSHAPLLVCGIALSLFAYRALGGRRRWLLATACGWRIAAFVLNLTLPHGVNYEKITGIQRIAVAGGDQVTVAIGVQSPWTHFAKVGWLVVILVILDGVVSNWRDAEPERRRYLLAVGGGLAAAIVFSAGSAALIQAGLLRSPYLQTPIFLVVLAVTGRYLAIEAASANRLAAELRASERRRRESEEDLERAADATRLAIWTVDLASGEVLATPRGRELLAVDAAGRLDVPALLASIHAEDRDRFASALAAAAGSAGVVQVEYRAGTPESGWRWLLAHISAEREGGTSSIRLRAVAHEVTARREAEELSRLMLEAAPNALLIVDRLGRILHVSARAETAFGYRRDELVGASVEMLLPERFRGAHPALRERFAEEPAIRPMGVGRELLARRSDGSEFPADIGLSPLPGPAGYVLASVVDISERRQLDLAAVQLRGELAHLSRVAVLGELSSSFAHELNQPLAAILSNAQSAQRLLASGQADVAELREIVTDIVADDRRAGEVIRRLRAMLRKEAPAFLPLDMNDVVLEVQQIMHSDFINRRVIVTTALAPSLPVVSGDRVQLQQVLLNLIINGCDAMAALPEPRQLVLGTAAADGGVVVSVADHGGGIPEAELARVFEPFVTTKSSGTGLGLAVCRTIVEAHAGRIWAANNDDGGATVAFALPAAPQPSGWASSVASIAAATASSSCDASNGLRR